MINKISFLNTAKSAVIFSSIASIIWAVFAFIFLALPLTWSFGFIVYLVLAVALPGIALTKIIKVNFTPLEALCVSFGFGVFINVVLYFIVVPLNLTDYTLFGVAIIAIASIISLFLTRKKPFSNANDTDELKITLFFCTIAAFLTFFTFSAANLNPELSGLRSYFNDTLMSTNLLTSASKTFPFEYQSMAGIPFPYHAFYYSFMAIVKNTLNMPSFEVITKLSLMTVSPFLVATISIFTKRLVKSKSFFIATMIVSVVVPCGYTMFYYLYMDVLGYPLGLAFCMLSAYFFFKAESLSRGFSKLHFLSTFFLLMGLGAKGPVAVTFLFGYGIVLFVDLIKSKNLKLIVPKGLLIAISFFVLYFLIYPPGSGSSMSVSLVYTAARTPYGYWLSSFLPYSVAIVISAIIYALTIFPAITLAVVGIFVYLKQKNEIKQEYIFFIVSALVSMVIINIFKQTGSSELYFMMCLFHFGVALLGQFCENYYKSTEKKSNAKKILISFFVVSIVLGFYYSYNYLVKGSIEAVTYSRFSDSLIITPEQQASVDPQKRLMSISPEEYQALSYIRDNTDQDAIIADGNYIHSISYFYGTAFSERGYFVEGYIYLPSDENNVYRNEYIRRDGILQFFYKDNDESFAPLIWNKDIDYIVISQIINPGFTMSSEFASEFFSNSQLAVYEPKI